MGKRLWYPFLEACFECSGKGKYTMSGYHTWFRYVPPRVKKCETCKGSGKLPVPLCVACGCRGEATTPSSLWGGLTLCGSCMFDPEDPGKPAHTFAEMQPWLEFLRSPFSARSPFATEVYHDG